MTSPSGAQLPEKDRSVFREERSVAAGVPPRVVFAGSPLLPGRWLAWVRVPPDPPSVSCQAGDQLGGAVDLVFGVVVVRGEPDQGVDSAVLGVQRVVLGQ